MRLALQNPYTDPWIAEVELSRRMAIAARRLGWEVAEVHSSVELRQFAPDLVLALHNNSPKLAGYPTYGCMWNPPVFFEGTEALLKNVLTYDGYLISSGPIKRWVHQLLCNTGKQFLTAPIYTSCPQTQYQPPDLTQPQLVYIGSNWDGSRFHELFVGLDARPYLQVYGNPKGWTHLTHSHRGLIPYDGTSVFTALHQAGVGLCLHRDEHRQAAVPSMRIFEIVAAGAVAICGEHPFIREAFGDTVLYIDPDADVDQQIAQIDQHMAWIAAHPQQAIALTAAAHQIFSQRFTLERLFADLLPHHQQLVQQKGFITTGAAEALDLGQVQVIVRVGGRSLAYIQRTLDSIAKQTYRNVAVLLVQYQPVAGLAELANQYRQRMPIQMISSERSPYRSKTLWDGLRAVEAEFFAILDDDDTLHPNHLFSLMRLLQRHPEAGVAYGGSFRVLESGESDAPGTLISANLAHYLPFDLDELLRFKNYITSNSYVARSHLLPPVLDQDPWLDLGEDFCLLLHLCQRSRFVFSYEATAEFYWRDDTRDNATYGGKPAWRAAMSRLRFIFWKQEFAPGKTVQSVQQLQTELEKLKQRLETTQQQHQQALNTIEAMKTSKFWQLRDRWFRLKHRLGLGQEP